jgi:hypothetical protein
MSVTSVACHRVSLPGVAVTGDVAAERRSRSSRVFSTVHGERFFDGVTAPSCRPGGVMQQRVESDCPCPCGGGGRSRLTYTGIGRWASIRRSGWADGLLDRHAVPVCLVLFRLAHNGCSGYVRCRVEVIFLASGKAARLGAKAAQDRRRRGRSAPESSWLPCRGAC